MKCDPVTGACLVPDLDESVEPMKPVESAASAASKTRHGWVVRYIGDPMCSWCWGISPTVSQIEAFCEAEGIEFSITMGGLRPGGGDPWTAEFKDFLRDEWRHIAQTTGQPFGYTLLEAPHFDYDTEPACRALATVKLLQARNQLPTSTVLEFFSEVQRKFYVEGQDPKVANFYASICASLGLDFENFHAVFDSSDGLQSVQQEFIRCRQWGVRSFPTLLLERRGETQSLAVGFVTLEQVFSRLQQELAA